MVPVRSSSRPASQVTASPRIPTPSTAPCSRSPARGLFCWSAIADWYDANRKGRGALAAALWPRPSNRLKQAQCRSAIKDFLTAAPDHVKRHIGDDQKSDPADPAVLVE